MSNDRQARSGWGVTNGIRADPHDFMGMYGPVEKDTIVNGSGTWVHTHDVWVLWRDTVWYICCNWTYGTSMSVLDVRT
jgi:hypothetical protein